MIYTIDDIVRDFIDHPHTSPVRDLFFGPTLSQHLTLDTLYPHIHTQVTSTLTALLHVALSTDTPERTFQQHLNDILDSNVLVQEGVTMILQRTPDTHIDRRSIEGQALAAIYSTALSAYLGINGPAIIARMTEKITNS